MSVTIPPLSDPGSRGGAAVGERRRRPANARAHVLLAEDDIEVRRLLTYALRRDGHAVTEVRSGRELLEHLQMTVAHSLLFEPPDVLVSDVCMPGFSGLDVLEGIRKADWSLPVILITAFGDRELHERAKGLGAMAVFDKPFDVDDLRTVVLNLARLT